MASEFILHKIKQDLRISHSALDEDIKDSVDACLKDLQICGVEHPDESDPAILNVIKLWTRAAYTDDPAKSSTYMERYNSMKATLMMAEGYGREGDQNG